jgi:hypothetical protein
MKTKQFWYLLISCTIVFCSTTGWCALQPDYFLQALSENKLVYYSPGGGQNNQDNGFRVDYWNVPEVVLPGQTVYSSLAYTMLTDDGTNSVVYKTVLADWQPDSPLVTLENGELRGPARTVRKEFSFTAPATPGFYRMRLAMTWAYQGINKFYGDGPAGDAWNPGVGQYAEVWLKVGNIVIVIPNGGENWVTGTMQTIEWNTYDPNIDYVLIKYSTNNGQTWNDVDIAENMGSYEWNPVPAVDSNQCLIRVSDQSNPNVTDISDDVFTIFQCANPISGDLNGDCYVDFKDFAIIAEHWLNCGNPFDPSCQP